MIVEGQNSGAAEMDLNSHWVIKILNVYKGYLEYICVLNRRFYKPLYPIRVGDDRRDAVTALSYMV